ncbi:COBW domain-containing protein 1 [Rhynchospora pubera]|uniref:COBW domain-containing protein 1 n=1 Tax=Rhynchospora pubera TaxID=906938 RepID=A0AAV8H9M9_9POAL|nr:COBW domain-containing protein 1 [Rhynchospora pubera]
MVMVSSSSPSSDTTEAASSALPLDTRVPATVITGFLGSGKAILFNHILTPQQHGMRIVVNENEVIVSHLVTGNMYLLASVHGIHIGLTKLSPIIKTYCLGVLFSQYVKIDGVVTFVDWKHVMRHLNEVKRRCVVNEAVEQVAYAEYHFKQGFLFCAINVFFNSIVKRMVAVEIFCVHTKHFDLLSSSTVVRLIW